MNTGRTVDTRGRHLLRVGFVLVTLFTAGLVTSGVVAGAGPLAVLSDSTSNETTTDSGTTATESTTADEETTSDETTTESTTTEPQTTESTPAPSGPPTIASDKDDYAPGALVTLAGTNWHSGETVRITVNDDVGQSWNRNIDVTANASGEIADQFNLPDWFVATYYVVATGATSGIATTSFTDGNVLVRTSGPTVAFSWKKYNTNTTCSGTPDSTGSTTTGTSSVNILGSGGVDVGMSLEITAPGTASGQDFDEWTSQGTTAGFPKSDNPLCWVGISGNRTLTANYVTPQSFNVTFAQAGIGTDTGTNTVLTVGATVYSRSQLPVTLSFPSGTGVTYAYSSPVAATAEKRYVLSSVTGPASPFTVSAATTVTGNYATQFQLSLATNPSAVDISSISGAIDGDWFSSGTVVNLTGATPVLFNSGDSRYVFSSWSGDATGSANPVAVTMNAPRSVTANYATEHKLTLSTSPGAVALSNISGGSNGTFYDAGTVLNLQAATPVAIDASSRYRFDSWSGDATGSSTPVAVTMSAPRSVTANYVVQYKLTLATDPAAVGVSNISGGSNGTFYDAGTVLNLQATDPVPLAAGSRWRFDQWSGDASGTANPVSLTMDAAKSVTAEYVKQFQVTFTQSGIGGDTGANTVGTIGGSPKTAGDLPLTDWFDDGTSWSFEALVQTDPASGKRYRLTSAASGTIAAAGTITGSYVPQFRLDLATDPPAVGIANISGAADGSWHDTGTTVNLTATSPVAIDATSRYRFDHWSGGASGTSNPVAVVMNAHKVVTANYVVQYLLSFNQSGITAVTGSNTVVTIDGAAKSKAALPFDKWYDTGASAVYTYSSPVFTFPASATQFELTGVTGPTSPITVGGPATITGNYAVNVFTIEYLNPLEQTTDGSVINTGKNGRVIPVKIELYQDGVKLGPTTTPGDVTMRVVGASCSPSTATDPVEEYADAGNSNGGTNLFRWASDGLIYNLDTKALGLITGKCYRLDVYIGGTGAIYASASTYALFKPVK
jgi:Divergent InlB B-repeat domain